MDDHKPTIADWYAFNPEERQRLQEEVDMWLEMTGYYRDHERPSDRFADGTPKPQLRIVQGSDDDRRKDG